jgi:uncharacterized membrane protein
MDTRASLIAMAVFVLLTVVFGAAYYVEHRHYPLPYERWWRVFWHTHP